MSLSESILDNVSCTSVLSEKSIVPEAQNRFTMQVERKIQVDKGDGTLQQNKIVLTSNSESTQESSWTCC